MLQEKFRREFAVRLPCLRCLKDATPAAPTGAQHPNNAANGRSEVTQVPMHTINGRSNYGAAMRHSPRRTSRTLTTIEVHNKVGVT